MRFDTQIYFAKVTPGAYSPVTGDYGPDTVAETMVSANVTDAGQNTLRIVYGGIKEGAKTIRIHGSYSGAFDYIRIGSTKYKVDMKRTLRQMEAYTVSEVQ